jgi:hypothetical protein
MKRNEEIHRVVIAGLLAVALSVSTIPFQWDWSGDETTVGGYRLWKTDKDGTSLGVLSTITNKVNNVVVKTVTIPITEDMRGKTNYFAVVVFDTFGQTSDPSNVVMTNIPPKLNPPTNFRAIGAGQPD